MDSLGRPIPSDVRRGGGGLGVVDDREGGDGAAANGVPAAAEERGKTDGPGRQTSGTAVGESCAVRMVHPDAIARAEASLRPDVDYADLAETFRALGDASRAKILHALLSQELCVCDLAALAGITESAVSQHLRVLRGLRIVRNRKVGRVVYYSLEDACIRALLTIALTHIDDPQSVAESVGAPGPEPALAQGASDPGEGALPRPASPPRDRRRHAAPGRRSRAHTTT
jgi:DNA-binding transcriptional ArsR family regulator